MRRFASYLAMACMLVVAAVACNRARVIPKDDFVRIYKDLYMADEWIKDASVLARKADTSYVYRPIIAGYGYSEDDFRASVDYYTDHPKEFASVYEAVVALLQKDKKEIEDLEKQEYKRDSIIRAREALPYRRADFVALPEPDFYVTRLELTLDSTVNVYRFRAIDVFADTLKTEDLNTDDLR